MSWFKAAFKQQYLEIYAHRSDGQADAQIQRLIDHHVVPTEGKTLDLCCGAGRHLRALRAKGVDAVGLDLSQALLEAEGIDDVVRGDIRVLPFADGAFDCVVNLFTSFGYFDDDDEHQQVLHEVVRVLTPNGRFVLDHMNPRYIRENLVPASMDERDGARIIQRRRLSPSGDRVMKDVRVERDDNVESWHESVRLFEPFELDAMLDAAGLRVVGRWGDLDASEFDESQSTRQVVFCQRDS